MISTRLQDLHTDVLLMPVRRPGDVGVNSRRLQVVITLPSRQIMSETSVRFAKQTALLHRQVQHPLCVSLCAISDVVPPSTWKQQACIFY